MIRTAGLFGHGGSAVKGGSFPERLLAQAGAGEQLVVVTDQVLNPTFTGHLAEATAAVADEALSGIVHLVAAGCCSYHEFAVEILRLAGIDAQVKAITSTDSNSEASRPRNGCLESERLTALPGWRVGLRDYWSARVAAGRA